MARPTVITPTILERLRTAFAIGCTDEEASAYAEIATSTLYKYQVENPEFIEEKNALKQTPILKARQTVVNSLNQTDSAKWYLERKNKAEFSTRNELTGANGDALQVEVIEDTTLKDSQEDK